MNQTENHSAKRNRSAQKRSVMSTTIQTRKLEIELPENAYNVLGEMAVNADQSTEQFAREMIYNMMECDLDGGSDTLGYNLAHYLRKKFNYDPRLWRNEESA